VGALLVSLFNVKWGCYAQAGGMEESKFCLFSVVFPIRCISSISPRFYFRKHAFCFLPLATILESPVPTISCKGAQDINRDKQQDRLGGNKTPMAPMKQEYSCVVEARRGAELWFRGCCLHHPQAAWQTKPCFFVGYNGLQHWPMPTWPTGSCSAVSGRLHGVVMNIQHQTA
jgi:hypothetical protein